MYEAQRKILDCIQIQKHIKMYVTTQLLSLSVPLSFLLSLPTFLMLLFYLPLSVFVYSIRICVCMHVHLSAHDMPVCMNYCVVFSRCAFIFTHRCVCHSYFNIYKNIPFFTLSLCCSQNEGKTDFVYYYLQI